MITHAVYAGTFDPLTLGHEYVIRKALSLFDNLTIAVAKNPTKKCMFSTEERAMFIAAHVECAPKFKNPKALGFNCEFIDNEYLVDYAEKIGATHIVRGIRNVADFEYERAMQNINNDICSTIQTVFIIPPRHLAEVSSSVVKSMVGFSGWKEVVSKLVSPIVLSGLEGKVNNNG